MAKKLKFDHYMEVTSMFVIYCIPCVLFCMLQKFTIKSVKVKQQDIDRE